ncbi:amidohydrolase [Paenarthrobacter nitroguajacolicus]|uniref:amidohydrolase n=1 Tax=Paenarthrobacter nitroguajacolicus TaxID=211146 RepID=UPI0015BF5244|nr:amidohydrolase [Paenarthrobacter nitroguajacolicus]NWL12953.1 amidohydrolase [Paenarthrobacter nitroguajacolicus]
MTHADWIFSGGPVHTMDPLQPHTEAVAVANGRIVALGADAAGWRGPATELVDLTGKALLPGFQDAHVHPLAGGLQMLGCDLSGVHSLAEYRALIADHARANPAAEWIQGAGWYGDVFDGGFPHRALLDELVPDRPVFLISHDGHGAWVNSRALERAGITDTTPHPDGGVIARDGTGAATGMLIEHAADLVSALIPDPDQKHIRRALLTAQAYLHSLGVTAWQDAAVGQALGMPDSFDHYLALESEGRLTATVTGALWWKRDYGLEQIELFKERRATSRGRFRATAVKIMVDGVCENLTAALTRSYNGHPHETGMSLIQPDELARITRAVDAEGFDLHLHAVGDRAVRDCVNALDLPRREGWDPRHQIAHLDLVDPADVARFAATGAIANIQPLWARQDPVLVETKLPYLDEAHQQVHFAFETLRRAGVDLAIGSDWPVSSPDPLWGIHTAVNRTAPSADPHARDTRSQTDPLLPTEAITLGAALAAYTTGAARANRLDAERGAIRLGMAADLVVLDADPLAVEARELGAIGVDFTFAGGQPVYSRAHNGALPTLLAQ